MKSEQQIRERLEELEAVYGAHRHGYTTGVIDTLEWVLEDSDE